MMLIRFTLATALAATGCSQSLDKGSEDDVPGGGKDDSFAAPTDHGELRFGVPNLGSFSDAEGFHAWTFTLGGMASIDLTTALGAPNLDTVMYLYRRADPSASWGAYIERNDDASEDTTASRLLLELGAGEYRVLVKAYKRTQRGDFSVGGTCAGAGCPPPVMCGAPEALPDDTGYGGSCGAKLAAIFQLASTDATGTTQASVAARCAAGTLERRAIDYYASFFSTLAPTAPLSVEVTELAGTAGGGGALVTVGDGGDESSISFVFDPDGALVVMYLHDQSPVVRFTCREPAAPAVQLPSVEACVGALVGDLPHDAGDEADVALTASPFSLPVGLGAEIRGPMLRYRTSQSTGGSALRVDGVSWGLFGGNASRVAVVAAGKPKTTYLATSDRVVLEVPTADPPALVCE